MTRFTPLLILSLGLIGIAPHAGAVPISGTFTDDARGDALPDQPLAQELGDVLIFPAASAIAYHDHRYNLTIGVPDDGIANDWTVHMENVSGQAWKDLYFVADLGATIGNADGRVADLLGPANVFCDAFHIDAAGANANLLSESLTADGIFEPGEEWEFAVSNFNTGLNSLAPTLITPGLFAGSSPIGGIGGNNASILASPVPEPSMAVVFGLCGAVMFLRRPSRMYVPYL